MDIKTRMLDLLHLSLMFFYYTCGGILRGFKLDSRVTSVNSPKRKKPHFYSNDY